MSNVLTVQSKLLGLPHKENCDLSKVHNFVVDAGKGYAVDLLDDDGYPIALYSRRVDSEALKQICEDYFDAIVRFEEWRYCIEVDDRIYINIFLTDKESGAVDSSKMISLTARVLFKG
jgi:hypothetical protein